MSTGVVVVRAAAGDLADVADLVWRHAAPEQQAAQPVEAFAADLGRWWADHEGSHLAFLARTADGEAVGIAWLALLPRVPRPGATGRLSADIQSVFVLPEQRGRGIGASLVRTATEHGLGLGAVRVTVHSSRRAVPVYARLGFGSSRQLLQRPAD